MAKIAIFDFDGVLADFKKFRRQHKKIFLEYGVSEKEYENAFWAPYSLHGHLRALDKADSGRNFLKKDTGIKARLRDLLDRGREFVLPEAPEMLDFFAAGGWELHILSYGGPYQEGRVHKSGITKKKCCWCEEGWFFERMIARPFCPVRDCMAERFGRVVITRNESKIPDIGCFLEYSGGDEAVLFVDDKAEIVDGVKKKFARSKNFFAVQLLLPGFPGTSKEIMAKSRRADLMAHSHQEVMAFAANL